MAPVQMREMVPGHQTQWVSFSLVLLSCKLNRPLDDSSCGRHMAGFAQRHSDGQEPTRDCWRDRVSRAWPHASYRLRAGGRLVDRSPGLL